MWVKMYIYPIFVVLGSIVNFNVIYAKRILILTNWPAYSHQISYRGLCLELHKRGHEIVWVTTNPIKNSSLANFTEIDLNYFHRNFVEYKNMSAHKSFTEASLHMDLLQVEEEIVWNGGHLINRATFINPEVKKLYATDNNEHFDAVIVAQGPTIAMNAFAYRFNAPLIGLTSLDVYNQLRYMFGSFILPSHESNWQSNILTERNMSFWKRLVNFYEVWKQMYYWMNIHTVIEDAMVKEYLGKDMPHINEITKNMSIYLVNKHHAFSHSRPEQMNVIYYHGSHIAKVPPPLPEGLKRFLDDAKEGFIYFSLGTIVSLKDLPNNAFELFVEVFTELPYKIIWKCDPDLLPRNYENILASKWFPQQSIFAHPNIKMFISQGGLQSMEEAIYHKVPIIGFPILWDQVFNVRNIVRLGAGVYLNVKTISKESIMAAIQEVANKRYKDRMEYLSQLHRDMPYDGLQNAAQWIEYVIRQNGTPFMRNSLCDEPWYQRYDWDIVGFLAVMIFIVSLISVWILSQILRFHLRILSNYR